MSKINLSFREARAIARKVALARRDSGLWLVLLEDELAGKADKERERYAELVSEALPPELGKVRLSFSEASSLALRFAMAGGDSGLWYLSHEDALSEEFDRVSERYAELVSDAINGVINGVISERPAHVEPESPDQVIDKKAVEDAESVSAPLKPIVRVEFDERTFQGVFEFFKGVMQSLEDADVSGRLFSAELKNDEARHDSSPSVGGVGVPKPTEGEARKGRTKKMVNREKVAIYEPVPTLCIDSNQESKVLPIVVSFSFVDDVESSALLNLSEHLEDFNKRIFHELEEFLGRDGLPGIQDVNGFTVSFKGLEGDRR